MKSFRMFKRAICLVLIIFFCFGVFIQSDNIVLPVDASKIEELQQQIKDAQAKKKIADQKAKQTAGNVAKEKEHQAAIDNQIDVTQNLISAQEKKISQLSSEIKTMEQKLVEQEAAIKTGVEEFKQRLRAMYVSGNDSVAAIMLGSTDFYDMLMKLELCKRVAKYDKDIITSLIDLKKEFEATKLDLETKKADEEKTKSEYDANLTELNTLFEKSSAAIQSLKKEEAAFRAQSDEFKKKEEALDREVDRLIEQERLKNAVFVGGTFGWPVPGYYTITSGYGMRWGKLHKGIDISGSGIYRKPIVAANSGTVIIAQNSYTPGYSYGKYVVIDHGGGYTTLYGHCDSLAVSVGQQVSKGDTIAYVGTTGYSTGYHLHFEIRENGVARNPMSGGLLQK